MTKLHDIEIEYLLQCRYLHGVGNYIAETCKVGVPLPGELICLNVVFGFAVSVIAEVFAIP